MTDMKTITVNKLITLTRNFCAATWSGAILGYNANKLSIEMGMVEDELHEIHGMDWDEIEAIEIAAMQKAPR